MRRLVIPLIVLTALVAACGGGDSVDGKAVQAAMPAFIRQQAAHTPGLDLPVYDNKRDVLFGFATNGADPDDLCRRLTSYLAAHDFEGVKVKITLGITSRDALASGEAGKGC